MSSATLHRWTGSALEPLDYCNPSEESLEAPASWLVHDGSTLALDLHRARLADGGRARGYGALEVDPFWHTVSAAVPRSGAWLPRVELVARAGGAFGRYRDRAAREAARSVALAPHAGRDPRTDPRVKGPALEA